MSSVCERESGDTPGPAYTSTWCADGVGPGIVFEWKKRKSPRNQRLVATDTADVNPNNP